MSISYFLLYSKLSMSMSLLSSATSFILSYSKSGIFQISPEGMNQHSTSSEAEMISP